VAKPDSGTAMLDDRSEACLCTLRPLPPGLADMQQTRIPETAAFHTRFAETACARAQAWLPSAFGPEFKPVQRTRRQKLLQTTEGHA